MTKEFPPRHISLKSIYPSQSRGVNELMLILGVGKLLYEGTCIPSKALSRGFGAPRPCTARKGLMCGLQQSIVVLSYGLVYHEFWPPALIPLHQLHLSLALGMGARSTLSVSRKWSCSVRFPPTTTQHETTNLCHNTYKMHRKLRDLRYHLLAKFSSTVSQSDKADSSIYLREGVLPGMVTVFHYNPPQDHPELL